MSRNFTSLRLLALVSFLALPAFVRAQTLADRVPAETTLYVGWDGVDTANPAFQGSNLQGFLADSHIPVVLNEFIPKVLDRIAKEDKDSAEAVAVIRSIVAPMWRHPTAYAFVNAEIDPKTGPRPKIVILCQAGNDAAAMKAKVEDLIKQAGPTPFPVKVIEKGDLLALVVGYDQPETAIPDAGGKSLATNPDFQKTLAQVKKGAFLTAYIDMDKVMTLADMGATLAGPQVQPNWLKARDMLGLKGVHSAILTEGFDGKDWSTQAFVAAPAPRSGFIGSMLEAKPVSKDFLKAIPKSATIAGVSHLDLAGLVAAIRGGISGFDPNVAKQVDGAIDEANKAVGIDIEKDLLANLGDEWAYYVDPDTAGNGIAGITIINRLKDPAKADAAFLKLADFINKYAESQLKDQKITIAFRQTTIDNVTVHYLGFPLVTPAWAVQDGNLYFGLYPEVVAAAANQVANKGKSIATNPAFVALQDKLGEHPVSSFSFIDVPKRAPENYSSWLVVSHLANFGDIFGVPAPSAILPPLGKLTKHLTPTGQIAWADGDGYHVRGISAFPGSDIFASDQGFMSLYEETTAGAFIYSMSSFRGIPQLTANPDEKDATNLKNIAAAAITYSNTHNGKYPAELGDLYEAGGMKLDIFVNPNRGVIIPTDLKPEQVKEWIAENSDYVWNGAGKDSTIGADQPLAWVNPAKALGDGIQILYGDYHVEFKTTAEATPIIEKAKKPADAK